MIKLGFTRPEERLGESVKKAEDLGFRVLGAPSMKIITGDKEEFQKIRDYLSSGKASFAVFGSITAVEKCIGVFGEEFPSMFENVSVVSIGPGTGKALTDAGVKSDMMPQEYSSYGIVDMLENKVKGKTVLLIRSDSGTEVLFEGLSEAGADAVTIATYRLEEYGMTPELIEIMNSIENGYLDVMAFTSPKSSRIFYSQMKERFGDRTSNLMNSVKIAAIGGPTADALRKLGSEPDIIASEFTFMGMLKNIMSFFGMPVAGDKE